ncbi:Hypothetical protein A7982_07447 [Minicystis rosea]|nr:Hypothetical protein A7982_07447 [Minicystis rosea]
MKTVLHTITFATILFGLAACESSNTARPEPASAVSAAVSAAQVTPSATAGKRTLRDYLAGAVSARVLERQTGSTSIELVPTRTLGEAEVKAKLASINLDQVPDGPLVRCPSTTVYELADKDGRALGAIGYCGNAARFDAPDGTRGGIR